MRRPMAWVVVFMLALPTMAWAHVTVRPRESSPGAEEGYTVRVPTEGAVTTTSVRLEIPDGVTVLEVDMVDGATFETERSGDRIVGITWKKEIKPKDAKMGTIDKEGDEEIEVGGKKLKAHWIQMSMEQAGKKMSAKIWLCKEIPGGMAKNEITPEGATVPTMKFQAVEWGEK